MEVFKTNVSIFHVVSFNAFWKFLWLTHLAWDFRGGGVNFGPGICLGFVFEAQGDFWVLSFAPIQTSLSPEIQSTPLGACVKLLFCLLILLFVCLFFMFLLLLHHQILKTLMLILKVAVHTVHT